MNTFYDLFEITKNASSKEIIMAYENKITKFYNIKKLNKEQIKEIKNLKAGLFILINPELRKKYNKTIGLKNKSNLKQNYDEPVPENDIVDSNLDTLFNTDNSWMNNFNKNNSISKKGKFETSIISDRIFSLTELNRPKTSPDYESVFGKPQQGRVDKSEKL